ncbi:patatin-like protein [Lachnospiraceae bacterium KM106-2]|nr:patatin-like protein [Lachnospiraceae bacterium KM106-2]
MGKYRILTIDGGGMRGIISAIILVELERQLKRFSGNSNARISDYFEMFGCTSAGSIIGALLLCPDERKRPKYSAKDTYDLFFTKRKEVFKRRNRMPLHIVQGTKYENEAFSRLLYEYLGDLRLSQMLCPCVMTSYDTWGRKPVLFNSKEAMQYGTDDYYVRNIVLASTAAPTYFPPVHEEVDGRMEECLIDGGAVANNPALYTLLEAIRVSKQLKYEDIYLFSVGNICNRNRYSYSDIKKCGLLGWSKPFLDIFVDSSIENTDYQLKAMFKAWGIKDQYLRIEMETEDDIPELDRIDKKSVERMIVFGDEMVRRQRREIADFARMIVKS